MSAPSVNTNPVANRYSSSDERIIEISGQNARGCLISIRNMPDGTVRVDVYRVDTGVTVTVGKSE